jgi:very-short-patch-repair endonuclease
MRRLPSDAERRMWSLLRDRRPGAVEFRRQEPIGSYIVDFVCYDRALIVEVDGSPACGEQARRDSRCMVAAAGFTVMRFWNHEVLTNPTGVQYAIAERLGLGRLP